MRKLRFDRQPKSIIHYFLTASKTCGDCGHFPGLTENDGPKMTAGREVAGEKMQC